MFSDARKAGIRRAPVAMFATRAALLVLATTSLAFSQASQNSGPQSSSLPQSGLASTPNFQRGGIANEKDRLSVNPITGQVTSP